MDVTIGIFLSLRRKSASLINSDANTDPPGVFILRTNALIDSFSITLLIKDEILFPLATPKA